MQQSNAESKTHMEIIQIYEKQHIILQLKVEKIFDVPIEERLDQTLKQKQQWVNRYKKCILSNKKTAKILVRFQKHLVQF